MSNQGARPPRRRPQKLTIMRTIEKLPHNAVFGYIDIFGQKVYSSKKRKYIVSRRGHILSFSIKEF